MLDLYCERTGPGFWDEPFNAVTNVSFLIAAVTAWYIARRRAALTCEVWGLIVLSACIGVGSFLWHTLVTTWAMWLDIVPILLFMLWFVWLYFRRVAGVGAVPAALTLAGLLVTSLAGMGLKETLNGSLMYVPLLLLLIGMGIDHRRKGRNEPFILIITAAVGIVSLTCRTVDHSFCDWNPVGTHFLWHLFNGVAVYTSMRSVIVNLQTEQRI